MPTPLQIQQFKQKARAKGYTEAQISAEIARKSQEEARMVVSPRTTQAPAVPVTPAPVVPQRTVKGLIQNAGQELVDLTVGTARQVAGAGFEAARAVDIGVKSKQSKAKGAQLEKIGRQLKTEKDPVKKQKLIEQSRRISEELGQTSEGLSRAANTVNPMIDTSKVPQGAKAFVKETGKGILRNLANSVGLTQDAQGNPVFDLEVAIQSAYERPISTALVAKDVASGVRGAARPKATAVAPTKTGILEKTSSRFRRETLNPQVDASPFLAEEVAMLQKVQKDLGLKGSAQMQLEQLPAAFKKSDTQIRTLLKEAPAPKKGTLTSQLQKEITDANYGLEDRLFSKAVETEIKILEKLEGKPVSALYEQMGKYRQLLKSARRKQDAGTTLLPKEEARLAAFNALKETIDTVSPEVKVLNTLQNQMYQLSEGLKKSSEKQGIGVGPLRLPGEETQLIREGAATVLDKASQVGQGVGALRGKVPNVPAGAGVAMRAAEDLIPGGAPADVGQAPQEEVDQQVEDDYGFEDTQADESLTQQHPVFGSASKQDVLVHAFQSGASQQDLDELEAVYDRFSTQAGGVVSEDAQKAATELRKEYIAQTRENGYMDVVNAYRKVNSAKPTAAGDVSLIFAYMKMLDPGSTVREGEFANAEQTAGIPDRIVQQYNKALKGDRLGEKQRAEFKSAAKDVLDQSTEVQGQIDKIYTDLARRYGIDASLLGIGAIGIDD